ncbi:MAG: response regulator [Planctomycetota bacterium]|nr:response regulator [Planctomycetota bacterium]
MVAWPVEPISDEPSVLITDDSQSWRSVVEEILSRSGFRTRQATCGEEAIELVRTEWIDIVLIDFHMPRLDGIQTLRIMRATGNWQPAVMMTGHPEAVPPDEAQALKVESIMAKPTNRQVIVTTVTRIVRRATAGPEAMPGRDPE